MTTMAHQIYAEPSSAFLSETSTLRRRPRFAIGDRPQTFHDRFEDRAIYYDCFWHDDGKRVLLVGPPAANLRYHAEKARFIAHPQRVWLETKVHPSLSVSITELLDVPAGTTHISFAFQDQEFSLPIRPNSSAQLTGKNILFSMNKDNDLAWIKTWAEWHARHHGTNAIVLFDNGSSRYSTDEIAATLAQVDGLTDIAVPSWPWVYGMVDPAVVTNPYWSHFLQIASMSVALRRFGARAGGLLNCDIDELVMTADGRSIYEHAERAIGGLVTFKGRWVEGATPSADPENHLDFTEVLSDHSARVSRPNKWALDPRQPWVQSLSVHPYMHWIAGRPFMSKVKLTNAWYWHFKSINTKWKLDRTALANDPSALEVDAELVAAMAALSPDTSPQVVL